jgi:hypothetical protein
MQDLEVANREILEQPLGKILAKCIAQLNRENNYRSYNSFDFLPIDKENYIAPTEV